MGGERFDMTQPEAYLFGENQDLNFLGNKPIPVSIKTNQLFLYRSKSLFQIIWIFY